MDKEAVEIVRIFSWFPKLMGDVDFKLTSPATPNYNCIAWAYNINNRVMWPGGPDAKNLDGFHYWPDGAANDTHVSAFIEAFELKGYHVCKKWEHEDGYRKIALYTKEGSTECTHASRELTSGKWTSKLGPQQDIQHGTPFSIEGSVYGKVYCIMKQVFK
jgi:hypothetical protein